MLSNLGSWLDLAMLESRLLRTGVGESEFDFVGGDTGPIGVLRNGSKFCFSSISARFVHRLPIAREQVWNARIANRT